MYNISMGLAGKFCTAVLLAVGLGVSAQDTATIEPYKAKKASLKQTAKEIFGCKKDIPTERVFSTAAPAKDLSDIDPHLLLIRRYKPEKEYGDSLPMADNILRQVGTEGYLAWNATTEEYDYLARGLEIWDKETGYKGVFTYDSTTDVISIHNAGMDGKNRKEGKFAGFAAFGAALPGEKVAVDYAEKGIADLKERFPQISSETTSLRFFGHSCGGPIALAGAAGMAYKGYAIDEIVLIDPYVAESALKRVLRSVSHEDRPDVLAFISARVTNLTPEGGSWLDKMNRSFPFNDVAGDIGRVQQVKIADARLRHYLPSYLGKYERK